MKAILVGAGGAARELVRRLGDAWTVTVIDISEQRLEKIRGIPGIRTLPGDGTSRLTLERSGLADADAVVAAANDDEANLEVCRLAQQSGVLRIVAVAATPESLPLYSAAGVRAFSGESLVSRHLELSLEHRRYTSMAFADGRAEAIEFHLAHDAPVVGKSLRELNAEQFIVGAVLRGDELIIPHGDTRLKAGDRVTVVGINAHFPEIVHTFTSGEARFPLDFGKHVAVALESEEDLGDALAEAVYLVRNSAADSLLLVHRDPASSGDAEASDRIRRLLESAAHIAGEVEVRRLPVSDSPQRILPDICSQESVGVLVVRPPRPAPLIGKLRADRLVQISRKAGIPVLLSRGTHPYRTILVPARQTLSARAAERAAIDLARYTHADLTGIAVVDPVFLAAEEADEDARLAVGWLRQEAAMQKVPVHGKIERGNPVRSFLEASAGADILILGSGTASARPFEYAITTHVAYWSRKSVLLVPPGG